MNTEPAGRIPQVDRVLRHPLILEEEKHTRREILATLTRQKLDSYREQLQNHGPVPPLDDIAGEICRKSQDLRRPGLRKIINGTGVILNTNLGRAPLSAAALVHISEVSHGYCNLELDLDSGKRGERGLRIEELLKLLTGCEAAIVVNNNAAAVLLAVNALGLGREVVVSRGELIEIGGSFRLPDVVVAAGGVLQEIGTTNRTRLEDYRNAIGEKTGIILRCHRSNFEIKGFTEETTLEGLVQLSNQSGIPLVEDLGSGVLIDLQVLGLNEEITVQSVVKSGCDVITFSGDKLLGGPQAGIVVGKSKFLQLMRKSPLYRALRADKLVLAGLEQTLCAYLSPQPEKLIPALALASVPPAVLKGRAENFCKSANESLEHIACRLTRTESAAGGGSLPGQTLESYGIILNSSLSANRLCAALRNANPPVVAVVQEDRTVLDMRTIDEADEQILLALLKEVDSTQFKRI